MQTIEATAYQRQVLVVPRSAASAAAFTSVSASPTSQASRECTGSHSDRLHGSLVDILTNPCSPAGDHTKDAHGLQDHCFPQELRLTPSRTTRSRSGGSLTPEPVRAPHQRHHLIHGTVRQRRDQ